MSTPNPTLAEYLADNDPLPDDIEETQTIPAAADNYASLALRELGTLQARIEANAALAKAERAKITEWETAVNHPLQERATWLYSVLSKYAVDERNRDSKRKTITLPYGILKTLPAQDVWEINDEEFVAWAKVNNASLVKVVETPEKAKLKQYYQKVDGKVVDPIKGDVVEGVTIKAPERPYTVTVKPN